MSICQILIDLNNFINTTSLYYLNYEYFLFCSFNFVVTCQIKVHKFVYSHVCHLFPLWPLGLVS